MPVKAFYESHVGNCSWWRLCVFISGITVLLTSCATSNKYSYQKKGEVFTIRVLEDPNYLEIPALLANHEISGQSARGGILLPILGTAISYATNGLKNVISHERSKYNSTYSEKKNDLYFYHTVSFTDNLDPSGIAFKGIEICRTVRINEKTDTALYAVFHIRRDKVEEMVNNSTFRLVLDTINVKYSKVKIPGGYWFLPWTYFSKKKGKFDLDINIRFTSSWVGENTQIFNDVNLGIFILQLRNIPLNSQDGEDKKYFASLKGKEISGKSFIIPRSFGHIRNGEEMQGCYGQGLYNVDVSVNECSKSKYLKISDNNSDKLINILNQYLSGKAIQYLPVK